MSKTATSSQQFMERPDLTPFLIHLTKNTERYDGYTALRNLYNILRTGSVWGSSTKKGFIKGPNKAACFMDVPFFSLKYVLNKANTDPNYPRYEPYGIVVSKQYAYAKGCRPVLYLSNQELCDLGLHRDEWWRVVRFEGVKADDIDWIHEREWRIRDCFPLPRNLYAVLVKTAGEANALRETLAKHRDKFKVIPRAVLPLEVICQGLPYMD